MTAFEVVTLFPELVEAFARTGIMGRAGREGAVEIHATNPRDFTHDRHHTVDDVPFGGGAGMVLKLEPVLAALASLESARGPTRRILLTPTGRPFTQRDAERLSAFPRLTLLCGRYEGIDDRIRADVDEAISIGDFVLNGGEIAAMAIIEAIARLGDGVLHNPDSARDDSFTAVDGVSIGPHLEHPHYTRPPDVHGRAVPRVLLAGDHARVAAWRTRASLVRTWTVRPELRPRWSVASDAPMSLWVAKGAEAMLELEVLATAGLAEIVFEARSPSAAEGRAPTPHPGSGGASTITPRFGESLTDLRRRRRKGGRGEPLVIVLREGLTSAPVSAHDPRRDADPLAGGAVDLGEGVDQPLVNHVAPLLDLLAMDVARGELEGVAPAGPASPASRASPASAASAALGVGPPPSQGGSVLGGAQPGGTSGGARTLHVPAGLVLVLVPDLGPSQSAPIAAPSFVEFAISPALGPTTEVPTVAPTAAPASVVRASGPLDSPVSAIPVSAIPVSAIPASVIPASAFPESTKGQPFEGQASSARSPRSSTHPEQEIGTPVQGSAPDDLARADRRPSSLAFVARMIDASRPRWSGGVTPLDVSIAIASLVDALRRAGREQPPSEFTP